MLGNGPLCKILCNGIGHWAAYNSDVFGPFCPGAPTHQNGPEEPKDTRKKKGPGTPKKKKNTCYTKSQT